MTSDEIIDRLALTPGTCGFMALTYEGTFGTALNFLITPERPGKLHAIDIDQLYHFYDGACLEVLLLGADGPTVETLGPFVNHQARPQLLIPAGTVHGSRTRGAYTLACTTSFSDRQPTMRKPSVEEISLARFASFGTS